MTERLHRLVDLLPQTERERAAHVLEALAAHPESIDPVALACALAPEDDEPITDDERAAIEAARAEIAAGHGIPFDQVKRELGL